MMEGPPTISEYTGTRPPINVECHEVLVGGTDGYGYSYLLLLLLLLLVVVAASGALRH